ncbi:MAG: hypothetical protein RLN70_09560 [Rhodospirillaceae bacterium]
MRARFRSSLFVVVVLAMAAGLAPASAAAELPACLSAEEQHAFNLRHLQSRFMVAALACNQREAYNEFVIRFRPALARAGERLIGYFTRAGGGQAAINKHITDLANAAGLRRAEDPDSYCARTWRLFWQLEQAPPDLPKVAAGNLIADIALPPVCETNVAVE